MKGYVTCAEAQKRLGVGRSSVLDWIEKGWIRAEKFGNMWVITEPEFVRFASLPRKVGKPTLEYLAVRMRRPLLEELYNVNTEEGMII